jgi:class 3 adenylate cyclase/tetratricopeptide (TPR) repeat protein
MGGLAELPEGPVTIMFTDIEGSTALRTTLGDAETDALLRQHDELIRERIAAHKGHDQQAALGDGFLAVFVSTRRAVACAIDIQRGFDSFNRGRSGPPVHVRIGLNTGEVAWQDGQLSGEAVHAAARVCAAGSGGQILVSDVTRQLSGTLPDVTFRDAGEFQLKGFPQPWRLYDVVWVRETTAVAQQVFVGRDAELARLRSRLVAAIDGHGGLVLVGGEPGVGKTTLVRQLIREAEQRGALAVFGRCYESEGTIPYSPFVEMLEQALAIMPPDIVREDMGDDAPEVARMVPALRRQFPDIGDPLDLPPEQQRRYFFNAVASFIARGSTRFPLVLVMDDVHWADEPTLLLIEHMAALMPELRVLGVGTYRDVELDVSRPLAVALERMMRARLVERIPVRRFDRDTVATMIQAMAGKPPPDVVVDAIFDETEGNPFFIEEVFRHLVEDGKLLTDEGEFRADIHVDELDVPESVRLVVGRRLERLGPEAQRALAAGAVVGRGFAFGLLEEIVDLDTTTLLDIVETAEAARVIVAEERDGEVHYSFGHELIRQTLLSGLSVLRRQRLHLAVADAIERTDKRARRDRPSEIAQHLLQAGAAADIERTVEYLDLAAQRAIDAAAFEEALRAVDDALAILDPDETLARARLQERRGWALRALYRFDECVTAWIEVLDVYAAHGRAEEAAALCAALGYHLVWLNRFEEAFAVYARGLDLIGDERTPLRALLLARSGGFVSLAGFAEQGEAQLEEAETLARELGDEGTLGKVLWLRTMSLWCNCRTLEAVEAGRTAIPLLRAANEQWDLADALGWASYPVFVSALPGSREEGRRLAAEGVALGQRLGHRGGELLGLRGVLLGEALDADHVDVMESCARRDLEGFSSIGSPWRSQSHVWMAAAFVMRGDLETALEHAERATELEPASAWSGVGWAYTFVTHAWRGDAQRCRAMFEERRPLFPRVGDIGPIGPNMMLMLTIEGCAVAGLRDVQADLYPAMAERVEPIRIVGFDVLVAARMAGMAAAAAERWDDAERHFEDALAMPDPPRLERPRIEYWYADMLLERGRPGDADRARRLFASALDQFTATGMVLYAAKAQERLSAWAGR